MPTGYTASVADGTITSLREFALQCARAFGATITMRDDPMSAEIPERFEPNGFYRRMMEQAMARLRHLQALSPIEAQREMQQQHSAAMARWREQTWDDARQRVRYLAMIDAVCDWEPPTPDHSGLRSFMLRQLHESFTFDCGGEHLRMPRLQRWPDWLAEQIAKAGRDVDDYAEHQVADNLRAATRTAWVRELRASLPAQKPL